MSTVAVTLEQTGINTAAAQFTVNGNNTYNLTPNGGRKIKKARVQTTGSGFSSGTLTAYETLDSSTFVVATDANGTTIAFTSAGIKQVYDPLNGPWPMLELVFSGGGGGISVPVTVSVELVEVE